METNDNESLMTMAAWDMYVSAMLGFRYHPGTSLGRAGPPPSLQEIADLADQMLLLRLERFGKLPLNTTTNDEESENG